MQSQLIALLILLPFTAVFIGAGIHEYRRYKSEGRASYGLVYDEETGTTFLSSIKDGEDPYDPEDYDPGAYNVRAAEDEGEATPAESGDTAPRGTRS